MIKIIFVCYNHGTGGETLAQQISLLDQCNNLPYKKVKGRTVTRDIFKGNFRNAKFSQQPLPPPSDKWYVVPSHFLPKQLNEWDKLNSVVIGKDMNAEKFYVVINDPITKEHEELVNKNIYEKVWTRKFYDILEIQGQIKSDGYNPKAPFFKDKIKSGITLGELRCLYNKELPTKENVQKQLKIRMESHNTRERFFNITGPNVVNITYKETLLPNFYQTFNNKLSKLLT